ncbi:MAG: hypothetical protein FWF96_06220, partial [Kiritimatiellaeota bacterium]|nr:hypothetical protein [Kiritimatiellota bacterium]
NRNNSGFGLDWGFVGSASSLTNDYAVAAYTNGVDGIPLSSGSFTVGYPHYNSPALKPAAVYPIGGGTFERSEMEFRWNMPEAATGFELIIRHGSSVVYKSGVRPSPNRRREVYSPWLETSVFNPAPELYANQLNPNVTYTWEVHVFTPTTAFGNSIQHGMNNSGVIISANSSVPQDFKVNVVKPQAQQPAGAFNIDVDLGFFTLCECAYDVWVEAFENAGFAGDPVARTLTTLPATRPVTNMVFATLYGLDTKKTYYVRAYVRANPGDGDALRKLYDPWGYICAPQGELGESQYSWHYDPLMKKEDWRYDPARIRYPANPQDLPPPTYWLPMYATDINNNRVADINEMSYLLSLHGIGVKFDSTEVLGLLKVYDGDPADTTGSGLPDSLEKALGLDNITSSGYGVSQKLQQELGLKNGEKLQVVIKDMPVSMDGQTSIAWTLGVTPAPGTPGVFTALSECEPAKKPATQVLYYLLHSESLDTPLNKWERKLMEGSKATEGAIHIDMSKPSGFFRVMMVEIPTP